VTRSRPSLAAIDAALEAPPGDACAAQRARGFRWLRFARDLEGEYLAHMRADQRVSTLVCTATALVIWLVFGALDLSRLDLRAEFAAFHRDALLVASLRLVTMAVLIALIALLLGPRLPKTYPRLSFLSLVLIGATAAISANVYKMRGLPQADLAEFAIIVAVFLPVGLTFYQSVATAAAIAVIMALSGVLMLDAVHMHEHLRLSVMLFFTAFVGAVGAYLREYAQRDHFLLRRLLHHYAMHDPLTGIGNRRFFEQQASAALDQARRDGAPAVLAVLDVDHFKRFNDRYGHYAGDFALKQVAGSIRASLRRPLDLVGRLGGEEFGILLYGARPEEAQRLLHRIVTTISDLGIAHDASTTARSLTVSIGAASFDGRETLESLYRRADVALYEAKDAGRNRARFEPPDSVVTLATRNPQIRRQR
jgi:diguanylate cyclase (GGDEF)-like protein